MSAVPTGSIPTWDNTTPITSSPTSAALPSLQQIRGGAARKERACVLNVATRDVRDDPRCFGL